MAPSLNDDHVTLGATGGCPGCSRESGVVAGRAALLTMGELLDAVLFLTEYRMRGHFWIRLRLLLVSILLKSDFPFEVD